VHRRRIAGVAVLVVLLSLAVAASAMAAPIGGARYDGRSPGSAERSFLTVKGSGAGLHTYFFSARIACSDGKRRTFSFNQTGEPQSVITGDTFSVTSRTAHKLRYLQKGADPVGTLKVAVTGTFGTDAVNGTITPTFVAKGLKCQAAAPFALALDGTPAAPFRDSLMATGTYSAFKGKTFSSSSFSAVAPGREVDGLVLRWQAACKPGGTFSGSLPVVPAQLTNSARLAILPVATGKLKGKSGVRYATEGKLGLRFSKQGATYGVRGTFRAVTVLTRKGKKTGTCTSKPYTFTSHFLRGPS
jgi:hypothetical protein